MNILLLEDSDSAASLTVDTINAATELAATVQRVTTLAEARAAIGGCDLLLADLHLPDASIDEVLAFCAQVRESKPVVIVAASYGTEAAERAGYGGMGFLRKPIQRECLITEIYRSKGTLRAILEHDCFCRRALELSEVAEARAEQESQLARVQ